MKELLIKLLEDLKAIVKTIIDKLFKKAEDKIPDDLGARWYSPFEADPRDFTINNVLKSPTDKELQNVPKEVNLLEKANPNYYVYQGSIPCCTCASLSNYMIVTECLERNTNFVKPDCCYLRENLWHKCQANERWDYLEKALKTLKNKWIKAIVDWDEVILTIDWYAYDKFDKQRIKYWLSQWYPIYYAFYWNKQTRIEMSKGEIKTFKYQPTGWHAVIAIGYDEKYLYFMNSWRANDGNQYDWDYSVFKVSWDWLEEMVKNQLANWRYWLAYNHLDNDKNKMLFKDFKWEPGTEQYEAVKFFKDKWIVKWVPHKDWLYLEPGRPVTRLELIVILYRLVKQFLKM